MIIFQRLRGHLAAANRLLGGGLAAFDALYNAFGPVHIACRTREPGERGGAQRNCTWVREKALVFWFTRQRLVRRLNVLVIITFIVQIALPTPQPIHAQLPSEASNDHVFLPLVHSETQAPSMPTPTATSLPGSPDSSFACLDQSGPLQVVTGFYNETKFEPAVAANKKFDARTASFEIPATITHAMISLRGSNAPNMCWAGGFVTASPTWHGLDISWEQSKQGYDGDLDPMDNTTSATAYTDKMTWTGVHVYNVHDGIRTNNTDNNWTVQHVWLEYIRDDCIENDHLYSGTVYDSLFDGCYTGISVRPSSSGDSAGQTITLDSVLLRMEPMPYPYKWDTKSDPALYAPGYSIPGTTDLIPFGYSNVFKMDEGNEPNFAISNSTFLLEYNADTVIFPPKNKVTVCQNNTIIWLGSAAAAPNYLLTDFPGCFSIITDITQGKALWKARVTDWHDRHPGVGMHRKPASPGEYVWPRY